MKRLAVTALKIAVSAALLWFLFNRTPLAPALADLKRVRAGPAILVLALGFTQISCSRPARSASPRSAMRP